MKCLVPSCNKESQTRGLCRNHYNHASMLIHRKQTTWQKLIATGKATEVLKKRRTNSTTAWFLNIEN